MVFGIVLVVVAAVGVVAARIVSVWWAEQPLGIVRIDGRVELGVGARRVDDSGHCGDSGELRIHGGRLELTVGADRVLSVPAVAVDTELRAAPRPSLRLSGEGWAYAVVVDRARPVPVVIGAIGRRRQATTAEVVVHALADARAESPGRSPADDRDPGGAHR